MRRYPFTPQLLDAFPEELAELFRGLELKLIEEICSRLKIADQLNEVTVQDIRALRSHGIDLEDIEKAIASTTSTGAEKLDKLLDDVVARNQKYYTEMVDLAQVTAPERMVEQEDVWAIYEQTRGQYRNLTQSMGFLVRQGRHRVMLPPARAYQWALDSAGLQVMSGAVSHDQAIAEAVKQLADSGLCVAFDKDGKPLKNRIAYEGDHIDHLDVAVRRAIMTGVVQLSAKYREQSVDYLETDLVETTAHTGARDTGDGPANHKSWQGRVFRWSEKPRTSNGKYSDFVKTTGYGTGEGLCGWNCRHNFYPFIEGISERTYTDQELASIDPPPITFEDRTYTAYQATQMQRKLERTIRKQKRLKAAYKAAGLDEDAAAAGSKLNILDQKYRAFSRAAGLPEQRERMKVLYPNWTPVAESDIGDVVRRTAKSITQRQKVVAFTGLPKEMQRSFRAGLAGAAPEAKEVLRSIYRKTDYALVDGNRSYYSGGILRNIVQIGEKASSSTIAHELFHKLDEGHKISRTLSEALVKDYVALNVRSGGDIRQYLLRSFPEVFTANSKTGYPVMGEEYRGVADILNGLSGGKETYGFKHSKEYWRNPGALEAEAWAQFGRIQFENNQKALELFQKLFPNLNQDAIIALKGLMSYVGA